METTDWIKALELLEEVLKEKEEELNEECCAGRVVRGVKQHTDECFEVD